MAARTAILSGFFFRGEQNLLVRKFLLLCLFFYFFGPNFLVGKILGRGGGRRRGGVPFPVEESQSTNWSHNVSKYAVLNWYGTDSTLKKLYYAL